MDWIRCDSCKFEIEIRKGEEYQFCPHCGSKEINKIDINKQSKEEQEKHDEEVTQKVLDGVNNLISGKEIAKLIAKGWEFNTNPPVSQLKGIKRLESSITLGDKTVISIIAKGEIDASKKISEYPLEYLEIAKNLGVESIIVMEKDYPCIGRFGNGRFIVIAPRVVDD